MDQERNADFILRVKKVMQEISNICSDHPEIGSAIKLNWLIQDKNGYEVEIAGISTLHRDSAIDYVQYSLECDAMVLEQMERFYGFLEGYRPFTVLCIADDDGSEEEYSEYLETEKHYQVVDVIRVDDTIYFKLLGDHLQYENSNGIIGFPSHLFDVSAIVSSN